MTQEQIQERIDKLEAEMATLQTNHDNTVKQFNQIVTQNQTRYAALRGGVAELTALKEQMKDGNNGQHESIESVDDVVQERKGTKPCLARSS